MNSYNITDRVIGEIRQPEAWQVCPLCGGQGVTNKPPYIAGDQQTWCSNQMTHKCKICNGKGIISITTGKLPE